MAKILGTVHIIQEHCKGCGLCTVACPADILFLSEDTVNVKGYQPATVRNPKGCTGCGNCAIMCPDSAITVVRNSRKRRVKHV